jgi:hypothetical protein
MYSMKPACSPFGATRHDLGRQSHYRDLLLCWVIPQYLQGLTIANAAQIDILKDLVRLATAGHPDTRVAIDGRQQFQVGAHSDLCTLVYRQVAAK